MCVQVLYKKLLNGVPTFVDLMDAQPSLAKGLQALLQYDGDDVQDVFCRTFEAEFDVLDTVRLPPPPNGPHAQSDAAVRAWQTMQRSRVITFARRFCMHVHRMRHVGPHKQAGTWLRGEQGAVPLDGSGAPNAAG